MLQQLDVEFRFGIHVGGPRPGYRDKSPKVGRSVWQAEVLYELRGRPTSRRSVIFPRVKSSETRDADFYHFKADVLAGKVTYSTDKSNGANLVTIPKARAFEVISMNKQGKKPLTLAAQHGDEARDEGNYNGKDLLEGESITRFDARIGSSRSKRRRKPRKRRSNISERMGRRDNASARVETAPSDAPSEGANPNAAGRKEGVSDTSPRTGKRGQRRGRSSNKGRSTVNESPREDEGHRVKPSRLRLTGSPRRVVKSPRKVVQSPRRVKRDLRCRDD